VRKREKGGRGGSSTSGELDDQSAQRKEEREESELDAFFRPSCFSLKRRKSRDKRDAGLTDKHNPRTRKDCTLPASVPPLQLQPEPS